MKRLRTALVAFAAASLTLATTSFRTAVSADTHSEIRSGSVSPATPMLEPRSGHSATLLQDGRVLVAGGMRRNQDFYRSAELYDPVTGKCQPTGEMNVARVGHAAVLLRSGKVLIAGGWIMGHGCTDAAELYDPATGKFALLTAKMTALRGRPAATLLANGDVLITGGADHPYTPGGTAELFHSATLTFEAVGSMHAARISHTATLLNDARVLIVGGRGETVTAVADLYDPPTKRFIQTGSMITARYKQTAGLLPDGRVLVAGGSDERDWSGALSSAEIYDPRTGRFTATSSLNDSRFKLPDEAATLAFGKLLIAGGSKQVEIYDPATGKFSIAVGELSSAWHYMSETRLRDGSVLLAGGYPNNDQATAQTWIFRP